MSEHSPEKKSRFRQRQRNYQLTRIAFVMLILAVAVMCASDPMNEAIYGRALQILSVGMFALFVFHLKDWRCPYCEQHLSSPPDSQYCHHCGAPLQ